MTVTACVAADGSYDQLVRIGLTNEKVEIYSHRNSVIDIDVFPDWC
jgi:hypothetical protein